MNNFINNDFNIKNNKIVNIFFQNTECEKKAMIIISEEKTIEELINIYFKKIGMNPDIEKNKFWFLMNGNIIQPDNKTKIKDFILKYCRVLNDPCTIEVVRKQRVIN